MDFSWVNIFKHFRLLVLLALCFIIVQSIVKLDELVSNSLSKYATLKAIWSDQSLWLQVTIFVLLLLMIFATGFQWIKALRMNHDAPPYPGKSFTERQVQRRLRDASDDASGMCVWAGDATFLSDNPIQVTEFKRLRASCKLLVKRSHKISEDTLLDLCENEVQVRLYSSDSPVPQIRGRLIEKPRGKQACVFYKVGNKYAYMELDPPDLHEPLFADFDSRFSRGVNPLIKHVVFDLAGVFFDGDIASFYEKAARHLPGSCSVNLKSDDYLCVGEELNLGKVSIVEHLERQLGITIQQRPRESIMEDWNSTWRPNQRMVMLLRTISAAGFMVYISSNCDRENGDLYQREGYLDCFNDIFFSYDMEVTKPSPEYFEKMLTSLGCKPYECIFIDDHRKNVEAASSMGIQTIFVGRDTEDRAAWIGERLSELAIGSTIKST